MIVASRIRVAGALVALLTLLMSLPAAASGMTPERASKLLDEHLAPRVESVGPGCVAGIARDGDLIAAQAWGMANLELRVPMHTGMVFDIGSTSKQFTAISVAILARRGEIDLDADIRTWLPDLPAYETPITVRHLIHHASGLPDVYEPLSWLAGNADGNRFPSEWTLSMARGMQRLESPPGSDYAYSNLGYLLLGEIVEAVSGQSLREFAQANIFEPMGMKQTHFHDDIGQLVPNRASAYGRRSESDEWRWRHSDFDVMGDGGVYSTLADLAKWYNVYKDPQALEGGTALLDLLTTPATYSGKPASFRDAPIDYGFGMQLMDTEAGRLIGHPGGWAGYMTIPYYLPEKDLAVITICNHADRAHYRRYFELTDAILKGDHND